MDLQTLSTRSRIIRLIRRWFDEHGFTEMHTPRLVGLPGQEPYLEPFWTEVSEANGTKHPAALITSPEYAMKRILAEGFDKIYDLGPCFRNDEPWDGTHDPEFLLLEWYRRDAGLADLMRDTEEMIRWVAAQLPTMRFSFPSAPFRRFTVEEAWRQVAHIEIAPLLGDREALVRVCRDRGQTVSETDSWDDLYFKIFLSEIEPKIGEEPTFLTRYPASQAALARRSVDDPRWADRVELYIGGLELANGFAELSDVDEQRKRFEEERSTRASLGKQTWPLDERFLTTLPKMGDAAGIAFGVDRFVMLLEGASRIADILPSTPQERFLH